MRALSKFMEMFSDHSFDHYLSSLFKSFCQILQLLIINISNHHKLFLSYINNEENTAQILSLTVYLSKLTPRYHNAKKNRHHFFFRGNAKNGGGDFCSKEILRESQHSWSCGSKFHQILRSLVRIGMDVGLITYDDDGY